MISFGEYVYWNFKVCQGLGSINSKGCACNGVGGVDGVQRTQTQTYTHTDTHTHTYTRDYGGQEINTAEGRTLWGRKHSLRR